MVKIITRHWYWLLLVFFLGAWFCRGMELAIWQEWPPPQAGTQSRAAGATPLVQPPADAPTCRTTEPAVDSPYLAVASHDAVQAGINPLVFTWQIWFESTYNPYALSPAGAEGIAQFMPKTAAGLGIDPWNPTVALAAAAQSDAGHLRQFEGQAQQLAAHYGGNEARYRYGLALAAYNAGPEATQSAWNRAYSDGTAWPTSGPWVWLALLVQTHAASSEITR